MTVVLIHGVPDTAAVWRPLIVRLGVEQPVALELPGFGAPVPEGFTATKEAYLAWITAALDGLPKPIDLVAHDWGSILAVRIASVRPDLVRSWVGGGAPSTSDYTWHTTARLWQTPGAGEKTMERLDAALAMQMLVKAGMPADMAQAAAAHVDDTMKRCILALYRSGRDVFREWEPELARVRAPGLVLWGEHDPYAEPRFGASLAAATGAEYLCLEACGHWWQAQCPEEAAKEIDALWRRLDPPPR